MSEGEFKVKVKIKSKSQWQGQNQSRSPWQSSSQNTQDITHSQRMRSSFTKRLVKGKKAHLLLLVLHMKFDSFPDLGSTRGILSERLCSLWEFSFLRSFTLIASLLRCNELLPQSQAKSVPNEISRWARLSKRCNLADSLLLSLTKTGQQYSSTERTPAQ